MIGTFVIATSGAVAGALHVLSGPDHLAAVAPLAADSRRAVWRSGLVWGLGHTGGVLLVGVLIVLLRNLLPLERLSSMSERIVGVALVGVGLWGLRRALRLRVHVHAHEHDGTRHAHVHAHDRAHRHAPAATTHGGGHDHVHASLGFGILHGLAGSSHFFGVLPALALPTQTASLTYLAAFGAGTVLAMTAFSSLVGFAAARARHGGTHLYRGLLYACSAGAIVVGGIWLLT
jgi:ABC-type nickel/cobalt efflux system permease component RcnA